MATNADRAQRWMDRALGYDTRDLGPNGNVFYNGDTIYSYGEHFPMAIVMREQPRPEAERMWEARHSPTVGRPRWVLLNGDRYSVTTSGHQGLVRGVVAASGLPSIIVPFTALNAAGIWQHTIQILEVRDDRIEEWEEEVEPRGELVNAPKRDAGGSIERDGEGRTIYAPDPERRWMLKDERGGIAQDGGDGCWYITRRRHFLGDSLFIAHANGRRRRFLSSFDYQEAQPLYFLCEMPRTSKATTVEEAYEDLKPDAVKDAESAGMKVTRQGDMFAIPTALTTKQVKMLTPHRKGRIVKRPRRGLLGTNHTATEVLFCTYGRVYARGLLYHAPGDHRAPDHARRKIGDGKTWHLLVKNTVPRAQASPRTRELA